MKTDDGRTDDGRTDGHRSREMDKTTEKGNKESQRKTAKVRKTEQDTIHEQERKRPTENKISLTFINTADYDHSKQD